MTEPQEPRPNGHPSQHANVGQHYDGPSGGWGSVRGMSRIIAKERPAPGVLETLMRQNKPGGHMCTSCAWTKPKEPHLFEFCENGAKATVWDLTSARCSPDFFAKHTVSELRAWHDHDLEMQGRLTHPLRYDAERDRYVECTWEEAFNAIGAALKQFDPKAVTFYASGRASLETSYLWALFARLYGHNNLPDSSNMCHETTSTALKKAIGSSVGTCVLEDFSHCDLILFLGQNTGSNSPRFLHTLQAAKERGCKIVTFNPVREKGLLEFANPQRPTQMLSKAKTPISDIYLQIKPGGDIAALTGLCKWVLAAEAERGGVIDHAFIAEHTQGYEQFTALVSATSWEEIENISGIDRDSLREVAELYMTARNTIGIYGMGLTQHVHGSLNIQLFVNLLLLRGNIGRQGTGISPVRGHSNVQGQRTVGISEKPSLVPLDKLAEMFDFDPPRDEGFSTVDAMAAIMDGRCKAFLSLGGNFARAVPDHNLTDGAWSKLDLNVQIATKLNRSHLLTCKSSWLLPCLVRAEEDIQASGPQAVSIEDSLSHIHGSLGKRKPASPHLKSEISILAGIAKATLPENPKVRWDAWTGDYSLVRELIEQTYPEMFRDFNQRLFTPGGFYRGNAARERQWKTESGRAIFTTPSTLCALGRPPRQGEFTLVTLRSNDQFNTTIYGFSDRLRGIEGRRDIVMMNPADMAELGLVADQPVTLASTLEDAPERQVKDLKVVEFDLPRGCIAAYYPEANPVIPLNYHEVESKTPAYKGVPVRVVA